MDRMTNNKDDWMSRALKLEAALEEIASPLAAMQKRADAEGSRLSDMAYSIANSVSHLQEIARRALED